MEEKAHKESTVMVRLNRKLKDEISAEGKHYGLSLTATIAMIWKEYNEKRRS